MESKDKLDRTIDSALAAYSDAEPLAGIEERVLYRVQVAEAGRRRVIAWAFAFVAAAALVVPVIVVRAPRHSGPKTYVVGIPAVTRPVPVTEKLRVAPKQRATSHAPRKKPLPKEERFPAHTPITTEERALLALAEHPKDAENAFADLRKRSDAPVEIQPIQIPPLESDGAQ